MKRPASKRVRGAGYAPLIDSALTTSSNRSSANQYSSASSQSHSKSSAQASYSSLVTDAQSQATAEFECRIKIHAPKDDLNTLQPGVFSLTKTPNEPLIKRWGKLEQTQPSPCTVLSAECFEAEDKTLLHELFQDIGLQQKYTITPKPLGSEYTNAEFVPFIPAVETKSLLGWAAQGFYYYFYDGKLMYEMAILGNDKFSWQMTESSPHGITDKLVSKKTFNAMLVPVAIEGKKAAPQHIFYRQEKLTNDELAEINAAWLKQNATLIDIDALKTIVKQPLLPRKQAATQSTSETSQAQNHKVRTNDDGSPEQWTDIAPQYGLSAKALLKLNPNYESDPLALKVGDVLTVSAAEQPQEEANSEQTCPQDTFSVGDAYPLGDVWGKYSQRDVWGEYADLTQPSSVINIFSQAGLSPNTPVLNVQKIENRLLRITVSFVEDELQLTHITSIPAGQ
ncbi:LysM peptidoglycan-binding domain-containing protein [Vibrio campbellii]|uniref:LysM peptidoglycan-binding domain-containing protein n=1 Tax=Vibrio campbellii TaxID=680 RepID=UPI001D17B4C3|nr:LysM peptidoglycan-binding domain-containing protein [Vibrio campbellii]MCC4224949.1 LysM peptidoglycan-binding domain-containing protein [Vibrio campbellii]